MGIDLLDLDYIVLSHGHNDHTGGLPHLLNAHLEAAIERRPRRIPEIIGHPHCFYPRPVPSAGDIGCPVDEARVRGSFSVTLTREPRWLTDDLVFLGEIDRGSDVIPGRKKPWTIVTPGGPQEDRLLDDSALAFRSEKGLVVITGCSHAGIINTIEYAKTVTGETHVHDVIGGLHLMESDRATIKATVKYLRKIRCRAIHPCHCTSLAAKIALAGAAPVAEAGVGLVLDYQ